MKYILKLNCSRHFCKKQATKKKKIKFSCKNLRQDKDYCETKASNGIEIKKKKDKISGKMKKLIEFYWCFNWSVYLDGFFQNTMRFVGYNCENKKSS